MVPDNKILNTKYAFTIKSVAGIPCKVCEENQEEGS